MADLRDKLFPLWRTSNIAKFYVLSAVYNAWFVSAVWAFIWGGFMTNSQIGIADAFTFSIGMLVEIPSGVFADIIGRRKAVIIGNVLMTVGNFLVSLSSSFLSLTSYYLMWQVGYAFQSGATEALAYDSLKRNGQEEEWHKVMAAATVIAKLSTLIATALGGFLFTIWFRLPYMAIGVVGIVGVLAALSLKETRAYDKQTDWSVGSYLGQIKDGFTVLVRRHVFPISLISLTVISTAYMYNWGLLRPLTGVRFGYTPATLSLLLAVVSLVGIVSAGILPRIKKHFKLERLIQIIGGLFVLTFFLMGFQHQWVVGGVIMILLAVLLLYMEILFSQFINLHTKEEHRATTLSAVALFTRLPYVLLAILIGRLADQNLLPQYTLIVGGVSLLLWSVSLVLKNRAEIVKT